MEDGNAIKTDGGFNQIDRGGQTSFAFDVVPGGKKVGGVETGRYGNIFQTGQDFGNLFEARADGGSHSGCVFDENAQVAELSALGALLEGFDHGGDGLLGRGLAA